MDGYAITAIEDILGDKIMPKGIPEHGEKVIIKDPITGKITGSKVIEFPEDKKAEQKVEGFTLTEVEQKNSEISPKPHGGGRPKGTGHPLSEEGAESRAKGLSPGKKKFRKENYKDNPICKLINVTTVSTINKTFLNTSLNKLTMADMEQLSFGESIMYIVDYYAPKGLDTEHPLLIMTFAILGLSMKIVELRNKQQTDNKVDVL